MPSVAEQAIEQTYNAPYDGVWDALRATIWDLGYKDVREDRGTGTIAYRTGLSLSTWRGQQMTAVVRPYGASTVISLTGYGAFPQLTSWGEKRRLAERVLIGVHHRLSQPNTVQPPSQQAAAAPGWYPDPSNPNLLRYFDGRAWTAGTTPRG